MDETETGSANFFGPTEAAGVEVAVAALVSQLDITPVIVHSAEYRLQTVVSAHALRGRKLG